MRRISFRLTAQAVRDRRKTVTRRASGAWQNLRPGQLLLAVDKIRAKSAEKLAVIRIVSSRVEPLAAITAEDVSREALVGAETPEQFTELYCREFGLMPEHAVVRRIEFEYVHWPGSASWDRVVLDLSDPDPPECRLELLSDLEADKKLVQDLTREVRFALARGRNSGRVGWHTPLASGEDLRQKMARALGNQEWWLVAMYAGMIGTRAKNGQSQI